MGGWKEEGTLGKGHVVILIRKRSKRSVQLAAVSKNMIKQNMITN